MKSLILGTVMATAALSAGHGKAHATTVLARSVIGAGGAPSAGTLLCNSTVGQPAIGMSQSATMTAFHGFWHGGFLFTTDVSDDPAGQPDLPQRFAFGAPAPNPTNGAAEFALMLPKPASVRLTVIDVRGRLVEMAVDRRLAAGPHRLGWDGRGERGTSIPSGVYYARLEVNGRVAAQRSIVVVR